MDLGLTGRVALVGGSSRGLGRAMALALSREGAKVALCARGLEALEAAAASIREETGGEVFCRAADLSSPTAATEMAAEVADALGGIDVLVNNAGGPPASTFSDTSDSMWQEGFELTLMSAVALTRAVLPHMKTQRWGRVINVTSISVKQPIDGLLLSNSIRAAVVGMAKTLATELAGDGILVNNVCPGYTQTERVESLASDLAQGRGVDQAAVFRGWEETIPMGRLGRPEELADLVTFLASERASYITGTTIPVDGGTCRGLI